MAVNLGDVFFRVNAKFINVDKALNNIEKVDRKADKAAKSVTKLGTAFNVAGASLAAFAGVRAASAFIEVADAGALIQNRLIAATNSTEEFTKAYQGLLQISQKTGTVFKNNAQLFQRLAISGKALNATQDELLTLTETVANLGRISGSSREDILNSTRQLAQGLGSVFFRAEEFNSIIEQMPALVSAIADEMGITRSEVQALVREGELLSSDVFAALTKSAEKARKEAEKLPLTYEESFNTVKNAVLVAGTAINQSTFLTTQLGGAAQAAGDLLVAAFNDGQTSVNNNSEALARGRNLLLNFVAGLQTVGQIGTAGVDTITKAFDFLLDKVQMAKDALGGLPGFEDIITSDDIAIAKKFNLLEENALKAGTALRELKKAQEDVSQTGIAADVGRSLLANAERNFKLAEASRDNFFRNNEKAINDGLKGIVLDSTGGFAGAVKRSLAAQFEENKKGLEDLLANAPTVDFSENLVDREFTGEGLLAKIKGEEAGKEAGKKTGIAIIDSINAEFEALGSDSSDLLAQKLMGEDTDFKSIAKNYVTNLLSTLIEELLFSPLTKQLQSAFTDVMTPQTQKTSTGATAFTAFGGSESSMGGIFDLFAGGGLGSFFGGFREKGGPVNPRQSFIVGEKGPELFMPRASGDIISNKQLAGMGSQTNNQNVSITVNANDADSFMRLPRGALEARMKQEFRTS